MTYLLLIAAMGIMAGGMFKNNVPVTISGGVVYLAVIIMHYGDKICALLS